MTTASEVEELGGGVVDEEGREEVEDCASVELADASELEAEGVGAAPSPEMLKSGGRPGCLVGVEGLPDV